MREILFRGKRADNGEWVYGVPVIGITSGVFMVWIESEAKLGRGELSLRDVVRQAEVIPETVGQYTGLNDKNGVKIFEGDVHEYGGRHFPVKFGYYIDDDTHVEMYGWYLDSNSLEEKGSLCVDS